jgi:hypothetical protein
MTRFIQGVVPCLLLAAMVGPGCGPVSADDGAALSGSALRAAAEAARGAAAATGEAIQAEGHCPGAGNGGHGGHGGHWGHDPADDPSDCTPTNGFQVATFDFPPDSIACSGAQFVRFDEGQGLWLGLVLCGPTSFRMYVSASAEGPFLPALDYAGHGQDLCEFIDPDFTIPIDDDITSGGCPGCKTGQNTPLEGVAGWVRGSFGEKFFYVARTPVWGNQTSWIDCAVPIVACPDEVQACDGPFTIRVEEGLPNDGYPLSSFRGDDLVAGDQPLLHLIGIYESSYDRGFRNHPTGQVVVHIGPTQRPLVLAFSSYEPTEWILDLAPGAVVQSVVLLGYYSQELTSPESTPVTNLSGSNSQSSGYCWPFCTGGSNTPLLVKTVESATGLTLSAFDGTYELHELWIRHECAACTPDCEGRVCGPDGCGGTCGPCVDPAVCTDDGQCISDSPAACDGLPADPHYCLTLTETGAALVGLESGTLCALGPQTGVLTGYGLMATSIAWQGDYVYSCNPMSGVDGMMRFSLVDGSYEVAPLQGCDGVASWNGRLLVLLGGLLRAYDSFEDVVAGTGVPVDFRISESRMTVHGQTLFAAWHSTSEVVAYSLPDGAPRETLALESFDTWIQGMSVTDDDLLVVNAWPSEQRFAVFNAHTGKALWNVTGLPGAGHQTTGLVCRTH